LVNAELGIFEEPFSSAGVVEAFPGRFVEMPQDLIPRAIDLLIVAALFAGQALIALGALPQLGA